jgi:hypothetical protein
MSVAVAGALGTYAVTNLTEAGPPAPPAGRVADIPSTAKVICTDEGARAVTPVVRPQREGVHIVIDNRTDRREFYVRAAAASEPNQGGRLARNARTSVLWGSGPGRVLIGCYHKDDPPDFFETRGQGYASFTVVDPNGLWTPWTLECEGTRPLRRSIVAREPRGGDLESVARRIVPGIELDDRLHRPGYPETEFIFELLTVMRRDRRIALLTFFSREPGLRIRVEACRNSGVGRSDDGSESPSAAHYPWVRSAGGVAVYAPGRGQPWGWCPREPLAPPTDLAPAEVAVLVAIEHETEGTDFDARDARVAATPGSETGTFDYVRTHCGVSVADRTVVAAVTFPHMLPSASLSQAIYYLVREERGWVVWGRPH